MAPPDNRTLPSGKKSYINERLGASSRTLRKKSYIDERLGASSSGHRYERISNPDHKPVKRWGAIGKSTKTQAPAPPEGHEEATPGKEHHPPASTPTDAHANAEGVVPAETTSQDNEPDITHPTQPPPPKTYTQDPGDGQWRPTPPNESYDQQEGGSESAVLGSPQHLAAPPGREGAVQAAMFTNAHDNAIYGGTFLNVAHIYESDSPAQGGGPGFPITVLGLQAVSFATRTHYSPCDHPFNPLPLLIPEPTSTSSLVIYLPMHGQEMKVVIGPFIVWLLIKMIVRRRSIERL